mmetsp:Transcript_96672/g.118432  ORF Transcript_96672/g.118432 Transcript_96672/m.118432 type:complete len:509 (-) Transcript_96672:134-1660(-)
MVLNHQKVLSHQKLNHQKLNHRKVLNHQNHQKKKFQRKQNHCQRILKKKIQKKKKPIKPNGNAKKRSSVKKEPNIKPKNVAKVKTGKKPTAYKVGDKVRIRNNRVGEIKFIGKDVKAFGGGKWYGIQLIEPRGNCNGEWKDQKFFKCKKNYGIYCQLMLIEDKCNEDELKLFDSQYRALKKQKNKIKMLKDKFKELDTDGDRTLDLMEFMKLVNTSLGYNDGTGKELFNEVDVSGNGKVSFAEFSAWIQKIGGIETIVNDDDNKDDIKDDIPDENKDDNADVETESKDTNEATTEANNDTEVNQDISPPKAKDEIKDEVKDESPTNESTTDENKDYGGDSPPDKPAPTDTETNEDTNNEEPPSEAKDEAPTNEPITDETKNDEAKNEPPNEPPNEADPVPPTNESVDEAPSTESKDYNDETKDDIANNTTLTDAEISEYIKNNYSKGDETMSPYNIVKEILSTQGVTESQFVNNINYVGKLQYLVIQNIKTEFGDDIKCDGGFKLKKN